MAQRTPKSHSSPTRSTRLKDIAPLYEMPIVSAAREIVGWTRVNPTIRSGEVFHAEAERLVGPIISCYVDILDPTAARRAGAPGDWPKAWRCLAICSKKALGMDEGGGSGAVVTVGVRGSRPTSRATK